MLEYQLSGEQELDTKQHSTCRSGGIGRRT